MIVKELRETIRMNIFKAQIQNVAESKDGDFVRVRNATVGIRSATNMDKHRATKGQLFKANVKRSVDT